MARYQISPNTTDKIRGVVTVNYELLDSVKCKDNHELVPKSVNLRNLSIELQSLNKYNYKSKPRHFFEQIQKLGASQTNNCLTLQSYIDLIYNQLENLAYLDNDKFQSEELLMQLACNVHEYFQHYGKYSEMGYYLGKIIGWYRAYPVDRQINVDMANNVNSI
jgi:hypothetical protein